MTALAWQPARRWLACGGPAGVVIWELSDTDVSWALRWRLGQADGAVRGMCWTHAAGRPWLVCASLAGSTCIWDIGLQTMDVRPKVRTMLSFAGPPSPFLLNTAA
eukprot:SAG22_NODE_3400_length_1733_cov_3.424725_2_plen_105_part_00